MLDALPSFAGVLLSVGMWHEHITEILWFVNLKSPSANIAPVNLRFVIKLLEVHIEIRIFCLASCCPTVLVFDV
jgi:hypothetical protein